MVIFILGGGRWGASVGKEENLEAKAELGNISRRMFSILGYVKNFLQIEGSSWLTQEEGQNFLVLPGRMKGN